MTVEAGDGPSPLAIAQAPGTAVGLSTCVFVRAIFVDILLALSQHDDCSTPGTEETPVPKQLMQSDEMFLETLLSKMCRKGMVTLHYCDGVMSADIQAWLGMALDGVCSS